MRFFGCVAYAHVPDELRKNSNNKGEKCIFVRYSDESKAYKFYNPSTKKVMINRDVQFIEEEAWDGSLEKIVNVKACIAHEDKEELTSTSNSSITTPSTLIQVQQRREQATPSTNNKIVLRSQASASPSTPQRAKPNDPIHFEDAVKEEKWVATMEEEIEAIERNDTFEFVSLPEGKHVIGVKWVYKTKSNIEGKIERHKARLVVKGYK
eukprot:PITA_16700